MSVHSEDRQPSAVTIGALLLQAAQRWTAKDAIVFPEERLTFAELAEGAVAVARSLAALGVGKGDHVGLLMPNCPDFLRALFATQLLGAVLVPINTRYRSAELAHVIDHADLAVLLTADVEVEHVDYVARLYETFPDLPDAPDPSMLALERAPALRAIVLLGAAAGGGPARRRGVISREQFESLGAEVSRQEIADGSRCGEPESIALMLFTSGTTSRPKGCLLSHRSVIGCWLCVGSRFEVGESDRLFDPLPLFHMGGIGPMLLTLHNGGTLLNMRYFEPGPALDLIERERATWLYTMFPPLTMALIRHPSFHRRDLSSVRALANVAPAETLAVIGRAFEPAAHLQGAFGMTEAGGAITCNWLRGTPAERIDTTGPPVAGMEARAVDPASGAVLGPGEQGELLVRGDGLFAGYYKDRASTDSAVDEDGWLHSGDLGSLDERGRVVYVGRLKEMLKVGGENVAPSEIESHLSTHPAIKLVQVVGAPDARLEEVPAAFIELAPGRRLEAEEVLAYCEGKIASFKVPRYVRFVSEWPMSATKIQKSVLRERLLEELADGSASG